MRVANSDEFSGCDISKLAYCALEVVSKDEKNPTVNDIQRGLFMGLCMRKLLDNTVVTFVIIKRDEENILAVNLKHNDIISILLNDGNMSEYQYYKASSEDQDTAFSNLSDVLGEMVEQKKVTNNNDIIDTECYMVKNIKDVFIDMDKLFPAEGKIYTVTKENIGVTTKDVVPIKSITNLSEWEIKRKEREEREAKEKELKETPMLIRKRVKNVNKNIMISIKTKIEQIKDGTYERPEIPKIKIKKDNNTDDKEDHTIIEKKKEEVKSDTKTIVKDGLTFSGASAPDRTRDPHRSMLDGNFGW